MAVTVSTMFIPVHDPDEALVFYRDALGLEVRNDVASGGFRWVTVGAPGLSPVAPLAEDRAVYGGRRHQALVSVVDCTTDLEGGRWPR